MHEQDPIILTPEGGPFQREPQEEAQEAQEAQGSLFQKGEHVIVKGALFKIKSFNHKEVRLKLQQRHASEEAKAKLGDPQQIGIALDALLLCQKVIELAQAGDYRTYLVDPDGQDLGQIRVMEKLSEYMRQYNSLAGALTGRQPKQ